MEKKGGEGYCSHRVKRKLKKKKKKRKLKRDSKDQEVHGIQHSYKGILVKIEKHNVIYHINIIKDKNHMSISIDFFSMIKTLTN